MFWRSAFFKLLTLLAAIEASVINRPVRNQKNSMNMKNDLNRNQPAQTRATCEYDEKRANGPLSGPLSDSLSEPLSNPSTPNFLRNVAGFWELNFCGEP